jgi:YggT family protein
MAWSQYLITFLGLLLNILWLAILVRVILSWFPIDPRNPIIRVVFDITEPVLAPFRRVIPRIGMFDLSPLAALLVISFLAQQLRIPIGF